jgi:hypothetical protein
MRIKKTLPFHGTPIIVGSKSSGAVPYITASVPKTPRPTTTRSRIILPALILARIGAPGGSGCGLKATMDPGDVGFTLPAFQSPGGSGCGLKATMDPGDVGFTLPAFQSPGGSGWGLKAAVDPGVSGFALLASGVDIFGFLTIRLSCSMIGTRTRLLASFLKMVEKRDIICLDQYLGPYI